MNISKEQNHNNIEEDEIDLKELWQTIKNGKKIIFLFIVTIVTLSLIYALKLPNIYKSEAILIPSESSTSSSMAGLGGLAAMAGISVGGGSMTPDVAFNSLLNNYEFMKKFVTDNKIVEYYSAENFDENYVFALGYRGIYDLFHSKSKNEEKNNEERVFNTIKLLQSNFSIASDKKTSLINVSYEDSDRFYPPKIINAFLVDASKYLVENNLKNVDNRLKYFEMELARADGFELRQSISAIVSSILKEKIMMKSKKYYQCDVLTHPSESYIKAKTKPKRALIIVVSFVTSIILGIFFVFFLAFIKNDTQENKNL